MNRVTFSIEGAHFAQKDALEQLINQHLSSQQTLTVHHNIVVWHGAGRSFPLESLPGSTCDLAIWISNDFVSCSAVTIQGITVPIWKCSTVTLIRHFPQLLDHLQKADKSTWNPTGWIEDLVLLRALDILIQGYQLTHPGDDEPMVHRFSEATRVHLKTRGGEMESPAWWVAGLGYNTTGAENQHFDIEDTKTRQTFLTGTLKPALQRETELASVNLNTFFDFIRDEKEKSFFDRLRKIRSGILISMPR